MRLTARQGNWIRDAFPRRWISHTDLMNIIHGYLLEGTQSTNNIKTELYKLNVYSTYLFHITSN
jgi:hypothetical protein